MLTPENVALDLLRHLGVEVVLHVHQARDRTFCREIHLYADASIIQQVLPFVVRAPHSPVIRLFEGDPPPF